MMPSDPDHFVFVLAFRLYLVSSTKRHGHAEQKSTLIALILQHTALGFDKGQVFALTNPSAKSTRIYFESNYEASHEGGRLREADIIKSRYWQLSQRRPHHMLHGSQTQHRPIVEHLYKASKLGIFIY